MRTLAQANTVGEERRGFPTLSGSAQLEWLTFVAFNKDRKEAEGNGDRGIDLKDANPIEQD